MIYEPYPGEPWPFCSCGSPVTLRLFVHHRYPRTEYEPMAVDPYYVHGGGWDILTCGNPQCEADAFLAVREQIIDHHLRMCTWVPLQEAAEQMAGLELLVVASPGEGIRVLGDDDEEQAA